ncbi:RHS repeat-associated core domain-containing protein [Asticcacaulis sp. AC460]|uniref:RHS repeat-associated core domain-containing protein n=1 Tax=Asticcacaulis sp. AC460 TaxID=1282360 RepID=UPI00138B186C|nr:RHS repeat-associated core domain-containing protein [Asticcacaulis sp. AC460]
MTRIATAFTAVLALAATAVHAETVVSVTQTSYDNNNRPTCTTVRMNPATYGALLSSACTLATEHATYGPDRITKSTYDSAGQVTQVDQAYGTSVQRAYARYSYSNNGLKTSEKDANGNLTTLEYDGFDRLKKLRYPNTTIGAGISSTTDYEEFGYDANDNKTSWRRRNAITIAYGYDNLDRTILEDQPAISGVQTATEKDVHTTYDSLGRITSKRFVSTSGNGVSYGYDSLGRTTSTTDINGRSLGYAYNSASAVAAVTYPDSYVFTRSLDNLNRVTQVYNGSTVFYSQAYTSRGLRKKLLRGAAIASGERTDAACVTQTNATCYSYDAFGRLTAMSHDLDLTANDITWSFTGRNPANQITSWDASSINYDYDEQQTTTVNKTYDGLNRDAGIAALAGGYDLNGNLSNESASAADKRCMTYDVLNRLLTVAWCNNKPSPYLTLYYDPEGRLAAYTGNGTTNEFVYDGVNLIAEYSYSGAYNGSGGSETMNRRYVHGAGVDEPLVWYAGSAVTSPNFLLANYQGSIIGYSNSSGTLTELYRYDPYGWPTSSSNSKFWYGSRFRYTGQYAIPEAELYYYKARVYDPMYGRFLQADPIGSKDDLNLYAYVGGDPINASDASGLASVDNSFASNDFDSGREGDLFDAGKKKRKTKPKPKLEVRYIIEYNGREYRVNETEFLAYCATGGGCAISVTTAQGEPIYRNGKYRVRNSDIDVDPVTGEYLGNKGISLNTDPNKAKSFGAARRVTWLPEGLIIRHTDGTHYEILPGRPMSRKEYEEKIDLMETQYYLNNLGGS